MNNFVYSIFLCLLIGCKPAPEPEINIQNLKESFISKDEAQFLNQFPKDFEKFDNYFGWDSDKGGPQELYDEANTYIDYWFDLVNKEEHKAHEKNIINICITGHWEADAIGYFQMKSRSYIKEKQKYQL